MAAKENTPIDTIATPTGWTALDLGASVGNGAGVVVFYRFTRRRA